MLLRLRSTSSPSRLSFRLRKEGNIIWSGSEIKMITDEQGVWINFFYLIIIQELFDYLLLIPGVSNTRPTGHMWTAICICAAREQLKNLQEQDHQFLSILPHF
jgi:hypothetical protein